MAAFKSRPLSPVRTESLAETYYTLTQGTTGKLTVVFPSLGLSPQTLQDRAIGSGNGVCYVSYSGFGESSGTFPGEHIIANASTVIAHIQESTGLEVAKIVGDSYGGLIALGLMASHMDDYSGVSFVLASPLVSFARLEKDVNSPQSKEGFVRYIKGHELIRETDQRQMTNLIEHKEIPDPFTQALRGESLTIYHYVDDPNLEFEVSEDLSKRKKAKIVKIEGDKHALANFSRDMVTDILS